MDQLSTTRKGLAMGSVRRAELIARRKTVFVVIVVFTIFSVPLLTMFVTAGENEPNGSPYRSVLRDSDDFLDGPEMRLRRLQVDWADKCGYHTPEAMEFALAWELFANSTEALNQPKATSEFALGAARQFMGTLGRPNKLPAEAAITPIEE